MEFGQMMNHRSDCPVWYDDNKYVVLRDRCTPTDSSASTDVSIISILLTHFLPALPYGNNSIL